MNLKPIYDLMDKIKTELQAWNVSVELNTNEYEERDAIMEETYFTITIFTEMVDDPIRLTIPVDEIEDYDLNIALQMLKFEIDSVLDNENLYFHNVSMRVH
ncbi:hypothetical protein VPIG_00141 [Vibrio phage PWH3a-P1]|uniref:hypothetical protein n=1 Tax=Vibrio phage PWH3a-P1 TaxID=754058 RepID=UPI0002C0E7C8|nr:hypothetical protein VPIG_00141 [Vibrio phage PWH3a-P1]AGH31998.1 hypothetical protein VPIG_00141 [Vibrio phage PWH3a-P1]